MAKNVLTANSLVFSTGKHPKALSAKGLTVARPMTKGANIGVLNKLTPNSIVLPLPQVVVKVQIWP